MYNYFRLLPSKWSMELPHSYSVLPWLIQLYYQCRNHSN